MNTERIRGGLSGVLQAVAVAALLTPALASAQEREDGTSPAFGARRLSSRPGRQNAPLPSLLALSESPLRATRFADARSTQRLTWYRGPLRKSGGGSGANWGYGLGSGVVGLLAGVILAIGGVSMTSHGMAEGAGFAALGAISAVGGALVLVNSWRQYRSKFD